MKGDDGQQAYLGVESRKKALGSYYTSVRVASILTEWCIDGRSYSTALDPTFGGCAFLHAVIDRLESLGIMNPGAHVFGVDIDVAARDHAKTLTERGVPRSHLLHGDFLATGPETLRCQVDAVVGNPPYVRHHRLAVETVDLGQRSAELGGAPLPRTADLWAYVLLHSLTFLRAGGRLALLLPGAVLQADYARPVLDALQARFASVELVLIRERVFPDASERTVALFAHGHRVGTSVASTHRVASVDELAEFVKRDRRAERCPPKGSAPGAYTFSNLARTRDERKAAELFSSCIETASDRLADLGAVRIGTVTGANSFFVRRRSEIALAGVPPERVRPVVSRSGWLASPIWRATDQERLDIADERTQLLVVDNSYALPGGLAAWIDEAETGNIHRRHHCSKRSPWYVLAEPARADALLPYMGAEAPRLVDNEASVATTNAVHGLTWRSKSRGRQAVLSSWTTFFGLAVELFGRTYGKGILKLEPSDAMRLPILRLQSSNGLSEIDRCARFQGRAAATDLGDRMVLVDRVGLSARDVQLLRGWQDSLREFRLRRR